MSTPTGVFLSAVSSEFGQARDVLAGDLRTKGFDVTVQEDFRQESGTSTTLEKLHEYIKRCEAVVCIIGRRSGTVPPPEAAEKFAALRPTEIERASYTQWEVIFALHHRKNIFVYNAAEGYQPDKPEPTGEDDPDLQQGFVHWLLETKGIDRNEFAETKDLQILVLKTELGTVRGVRRIGGQSEAGLDVEEARGANVRKKDTARAHRLPEIGHALVGRDYELADVVEAIDRRKGLVMLVGEPGVGKRTLLQELTHSGDLPSDFRDGAAIHPAVKTSESLEDLRQAIWEEFYEANDPSTVQPHAREAALLDINGLVFLADIDRSTSKGKTATEGVPSAGPLVDIIGDFLDEMPGAVFCITGTETNTADLPGEAIPIDGLASEAEMLELFEVLYESEVPVEVQRDVIALCASTGGNAGAIDLLARDARKAARRARGAEGDPLIAWAAARAPGAESAEQKQAMAVVAEVGTEVPRAVIVDVVGSSAVVDDAVEDGRLEEGSPRYRLNPVLAAPTRESLDDGLDRQDILHEVFQSAVAWAADALHAEIYENRAFVLRMLHWGLDSARDLAEHSGADAVPAAHERWCEVIELGRATEPAMALGGRHGAWEEVLKCVEAASRSDLERSPSTSGGTSTAGPTDGAVTDRSQSSETSLGWALHQLGSRALLRDELRSARTYLNKSLHHRTDDGDRELTRKNLMLVPLAILPFAVLLFVPLLLVSVAAAVLNPFDNSAPTVDITPDFLSFDSGDVWLEFKVENVGDGPVEIKTIDIGEAGADRADSGFAIQDPADAGDGACKEGAQIQKGESCTIRVKSDGSLSTALLGVQVESRTRLSGDESAVLISEP